MKKITIGQRFGKLTVEELLPSQGNGKREWLCRCDCGGTKIVPTVKLNNGSVKSCGCMRQNDITGMVFGKCTAIRNTGERVKQGTTTTDIWECRCECGAITFKTATSLKRQGVSMCDECQKIARIKNIHEKGGYINGTRIYQIDDMTPGKANKSGYRGVYFEKRSGKYCAQLRYRGKKVLSALFDTLSEAVIARKEAEEKYYGTFLKTLETSSEDNKKDTTV